MATPIQEIRSKFFILSDTEFKYWIYENFDFLLEKEIKMVSDAFDAGKDWSERSGVGKFLYIDNLYNQSK
jgi:hypothetical protein